MKRPLNVSTLVVCLTALGLLAVLPQPAQACGYFCNLVSDDPICFRCEYSGDEGGGCVQTSPCSCYEVVCAIGSAVAPEDTALATLGFVPADLQKDKCAAASPVTAAVAD